MEIFTVIILALVQGLTEFLPVSSSGHLLIAHYLLGSVTPASIAFDAYLHLGTLVAVLIYYRRTWVTLIRAVVSPRVGINPERQTAWALVIATIPAGLAGLALRHFETLLVSSPQRLAGQLLITALALGLADRLRVKPYRDAAVSYRDALLIGIMQIAALLPGISRSGITIAAGRARGLSRQAATDFSFLMSAPIIAGAGLTSLADLVTYASISPGLLGLGFLVSCVSGLVAISFLMRLIARVSFTPFVVYLVLLAGVVWYA